MGLAFPTVSSSASLMPFNELTENRTSPKEFTEDVFKERVTYHIKYFLMIIAKQLLKKYGFPIIVFIFGLHLHAQSYKWHPFWDFDEGRLFDEPSILAKSMNLDMSTTQAVTARWLMFLGIIFFSIIYFKLLNQFNNKRNNLTNEFLDAEEHAEEHAEEFEFYHKGEKKFGDFDLPKEKKDILHTLNTVSGSYAGEECHIEISPNLMMTFCWCPPGSFTTFSNELDQYSRIYKSVDVIISEGYWIGKYPVTEVQWEAVMGNDWDWKSEPRVGILMEGVAFSYAQMFVDKLNSLLNYKYGMIMSLPTEAQWECASRADAADNKFTENIYLSTGRDTGYDYGYHVGMQEPNNLGLCDMNGNLWEWCNDRYAVNRSGGIDPKGPLTGIQRVMRASCFHRMSISVEGDQLRQIISTTFDAPPMNNNTGKPYKCATEGITGKFCLCCKIGFRVAAIKKTYYQK